MPVVQVTLGLCFRVCSTLKTNSLSDARLSHAQKATTLAADENHLKSCENPREYIHHEQDVYYNGPRKLLVYAFGAELVGDLQAAKR